VLRHERSEIRIFTIPGIPLGLIEKYRLFFRILIYFLILLVPLLVISTIYYLNVSKMIKDDSVHKAQQNLKSSAQNVDLYLRTIHETSLNLLEDNTVRKYFFPEALQTLREKAELSEITRIISRYSSIVSNYSHSMFLFIDNRKVYLPRGAEDFDLFFGKFYKMDTYPAQFWEAQLDGESDFQILPPTGQAAGIWLIPVITRGIVNGEFAITCVTIPINKLDQLFSGSAIFPSTQFVITDNQNRLIFSTGNEAHEFSKSVFINQEPASVTDIHGDSFAVSYYKSVDYGWNYYAITPTAALNQTAKGVYNFMLAISALIIGISCLFSVWFSVKIYNPIKKIRDIIHDQSEDEDTTSPDPRRLNELEFIGSGIRRLYDNNEYFKNKFKHISNEYIEHTLLNLIRGNQLEHEEEFTWMLNNELGFTGNHFLCCNIHFQFNGQFYRDIQDVDRFMIFNKLKNVLYGLMKPFVTLFVTEYQQNLYVCMVNLKRNEDKPDLLKALNDIVQTFQYDFEYCRINIGIGKTYGGLSQLASSFSDAMTALGTAESERKFQIIDSEQLSLIDHYYYSFADENQLINLVKVGDMVQVQHKITEILSTNKEKGVSHHYMLMLLAELRNTAYKFAVEKGLSALVQHTQPQATLNDEETLQNLLDLFREIIIGYTRGEDGGEAKQDSLVSSIIQYVDGHYTEDLYLEHIAEQMGLSSKYVSKVFKEKTGTNLTDYISLIRIAKAKELLIHTSLNISVVGERVGIFSRTTFLRTFKKWEGISPLEFRQANTERNS
jgi:two-component system response regulator YesN